MPLQPIADGVWCVNAHFDTTLFRGSVRMTVIAGEGGLVLYSPVALDDATRDAIDALGPVAAIVAPNTFHHRHLRDAAAAYPNARVFVPEGLEAKIGPVPRAEPMPGDNPPALPGGIEAFIFAGHSIHETVLYHRASGTLVTADLLYNYQPEHGRGEKRFFRLLGCYGAPKVVFYHRFALRDKAGLHALIAQVQAWAPRRIVMAHGRIVEADDAAGIFAAAWARFG